MYISIYLAPRHQRALGTLLHALYTKGSAQYHQFLTPAQYGTQFAASQSSVDATSRWLASHRLKVTSPASEHHFVDAVGTVATVQKTFGVTENVYRYKHMNLRANAHAPRVPSSLAPSVAFIGGLDDSAALIKPMSKVPSASPGPGYSTPGPCSQFWADKTATVTPAHQYGSTLPWVPCGYTPPQIRAAYGVDKTGLSGAGVTVGITDAFASPTIVQDVNRFSANYGLPPLTTDNFQQIAHPGTFNIGESVLDPQGWYGEESLDVEWVHAMAPQANIVYAGANNSEVPLDHALEQLIQQNKVDIITNSWGIYGEYQAPGHFMVDEAYFQQAAAQGISVLFSSGDNGDVSAETGLAQASYPASSPWVTAVGGTSLAVNDSAGNKNEWGWGTYRSFLCEGTTPVAMVPDCSGVTPPNWSPWPPTYLYGSGGGVSLHFLQPDYQKGVVPDALASGTTTASGSPITFSSPHRVVPDVSMVGDPNTGALYGQTYDKSGDPLIDVNCVSLSATQEYCERRIGGTSLSSPLFAGVLALADQANGGRVGFVNPAIYDASATGSGAIQDVLPPVTPTAVLRNVEYYDAAGNPLLVTTLRTINSVPATADGPVIEGADSSLRTTPGYDNVTGVGTPYAPNLVNFLSSWGG
jgi:subtilase family serine protease